MKRIDFGGKRVLITGASQGIGKALAAEFARRGAHLALGALPSESDALDEVSSSLSSKHGIDTWRFPIDLLDDDGPDRLFREVTEAVGDLDALVNNAGTAAYGHFWDADWEAQLRTYHLNLTVPMRTMRLFLPAMVARGDGVIYNISSVSALQPTPFQSVYGATKAGLQSLSQGVRAELKGTGVTVCTLNPPYTDTAILKVEGYPEHLRWYSLSGLKTPEWIAAKALLAFERRRFMYVPGLNAWLSHIALPRFFPRLLVDAVSHRFLQASSR